MNGKEKGSSGFIIDGDQALIPEGVGGKIHAASLKLRNSP
jgi:hypothetical protein